MKTKASKTNNNDKGTAENAKGKTLTDKEKHEKAIRDKNNAEMKAAKGTLAKFKDTKEYSKLPTDIQAAITRVIGKAPGGSGVGRDTFADALLATFPKVKTSINELDIFKATKMGRSEFRKRIRESLKKAKPENRRWVEFDEETECWTLLAVGAEMPEGFKGKAIDDVAEVPAEK